MEITNIENILTETIGYEVNNIRTGTNDTVKKSSELFDPVLFAYSGLAKIQSTFEIAWSLQKDDEGWVVKYQDIAS